MSTPEIGMSLSPIITLEQSPENAVWIAHLEQVGNVLVDRMSNQIINSPKTVKKFSVVGEPSIMKTSLHGQAAQELAVNPAINKALAEVNKILAYKYISTAMIIKTGMARGWIDGTFGDALDPDQVVDTSQRVDAGLQGAEQDLPHEESDVVHIFLQEFAIDEVVDLGITTIRRYSGDDDAFIVFVPSLPEIQEEGYRERSALWEGRKDPKRMLRAFGTVLDMDPEEARLTMGSPLAIQRMVERRNLAMYEVWEQNDGTFTLPNTPWSILNGNDPRGLSGASLREYFMQLTEFSHGRMKTNPIRPYLLTGYYEYLAEKWGLAGNSLVLTPRFVSDIIYGKPGYLARHALDIDKYIDRAEERGESQGADVFIAQNHTM